MWRVVMVASYQEKKNWQFLLLPRQSESFILSLEDIGIQYFDIFFKTDLC